LRCARHGGNRVGCIDNNGEPNAGWNAGNCGTIAGWSDNLLDDTRLTMDVWNTVVPECQ